MDWTARVDAKAAFAFTVESVVLTAAISLTAENRIFALLDNPIAEGAFLISAAVLAVAALLALLAVRPQLRRRQAAGASVGNFIYFGHAQNWNEVKLAAALEKEDLLLQLTRQVVVMSKITWTKHLLISWSISLAGSASIALTVQAVVLRFV
ncbi:Pycsar system effector family protein [Rathayibacter sp. VKM Ac-2630]|uniref:Pycsar system effector family protein n=1 Tax=Rathayibacter sp. VKM Ac-2630 TaxID=1938617 RepID=UPI00098154A7|nr:Pycsar system effector family protein [Rathayibacter sp. VKM Ac-2630]OOB90945.1 hypothetical protein B0T42_08830 [Rathayibacter sp. VKM Ac-2630]